MEFFTLEHLFAVSQIVHVSMGSVLYVMGGVWPTYSKDLVTTGNGFQMMCSLMFQTIQILDHGATNKC